MRAAAPPRLTITSRAWGDRCKNAGSTFNENQSSAS